VSGRLTTDGPPGGGPGGRLSDRVAGSLALGGDASDHAQVSSRERFLRLPPGYDPFAPRPVASHAFPAKRLIVVLRSDAKSDRYALHRFPDGSVCWRADTFTAPEDPAEPECWIAHRGELTVAQVIEVAPDHGRAVLEWTRAEIAKGTEIIDSADPHVWHCRVRSLERLRRELEVASGGGSERAA